MQLQLNSELTHADVVSITAAPPSGSSFTATDAAVSSEFFIANTSPNEREIAYLEWRILLQVCDMQLAEYELATNGDSELWKTRLLSTLQWINRKAQLFNPSQFPCDLKPVMAGSVALCVTGVNWLDAMTQRLSVIFLNAQSVNILKIEIQDAVPVLNLDTTPLYNLPAPL